MTAHHVKMTVVVLMMRHALTNSVLHVLTAHPHHVNLIVMRHVVILIVMHNHAFNSHVVLKMHRIALMQIAHVVQRLHVQVAVMMQPVTLTHVNFLHVI
jgi:hypothetical protein